MPCHQRIRRKAVCRTLLKQRAFPVQSCTQGAKCARTERNTPYRRCKATQCHPREGQGILHAVHNAVVTVVNCVGKLVLRVVTINRTAFRLGNLQHIHRTCTYIVKRIPLLYGTSPAIREADRLHTNRPVFPAGRDYTVFTV